MSKPLTQEELDRAKLVGLNPAQRVQETFSIVSSTLEKYGCAIAAISHIEGNYVEQFWRIVALPKKGGETAAASQAVPAIIRR